jgi:predicted ester cyclase
MAQHGRTQTSHRFLERLLAVFICVTALCCTETPRSEPDTAPPAAPQNKAIVERWIEEGFNQGKLDVVDDIFADSLVINGHAMLRDDLKQSMRGRRAAFPDLHVTIDAMIAEGDQVAMWYTAHGTQHGEFDGVAPTGRAVTWVGSDLLEITGGRITKARFIDDSLGLLRLLGATLVLPRPG